MKRCLPYLIAIACAAAFWLFNTEPVNSVVGRY
jgi:hypothetical protein